MSLLVNYDNTDSEDNSEDEQQSTQIRIESTNTKSVNDSNAVFSSSKAGHSAPTSKEDQPEMIILPSQKELELRIKPPAVNAKNKIVINLPSLSMSDDEDEPPVKKMHFKSESSLLASLPAPKFVPTKQTNRPLIPHSVSAKAALVVAPQKPARDDYDDEFEEDEDDDDDVGTGMNFLVSVEDDNQPTFHESSLYRYQEGVDYDEDQMETSHYQQDAGQTNQSNIPLDFARDKQFQKLMTSQDGSDVSFMDVSVDNYMKKYETLRLRELTKENPMGHGHKATNQANPQSKRKHQITYLALQAKEREFDLKNQWAENKFMRKQSQNKYGF